MRKVTQEELVPNKFCDSCDFVEEHYIEDINIEDVHYNRELLSKKLPGFKGNIKEFCNANSDLSDRYFEPHIFNEEIALECGFIPFTFSYLFYNNIKLLALYDDANTTTDLSSKLDAYQVLTQGKIDKASLYFSHKKYFKRVVGKKVMDKMNKILNEEIL